MFYFAKFLSQIGLRINFRKVYFHYQEKLPKDKAIIFAVNHPTAFIDPVLIGTYLERPTHFIVRGDIFKGKIILAILNGLKMIPIFRFRDGFSNLKSNQATMETVYEKLSNKKWVLVLAEGVTKHEKRLRPIQKGTARMAFGAMEAHGLKDILIVPIGVNYTDAHQFRSFIMAEVGKPITLEEYLPAYNENSRKGIKQLTDRIEKEMRLLVTHIKEEADDKWIDRILEIKRNDFKYPIFPIKSSDPSLLKGEYKAVEKMNAFTETQKTTTEKAVKNYDQQLQKLNVLDQGLAKATSFNFSNTLLLILGFIPFLIGYIGNYLPMWLAENTAKTKVKKIEFYASVRYGAGLFGYPVYYLLLIIISLIIGNSYLIGLCILIPFIGYFSLIYMELFEKWNVARKFKALKKEDQKLLKEARKVALGAL